MSQATEKSPRRTHHDSVRIAVDVNATRPAIPANGAEHDAATPFHGNS